MMMSIRLTSAEHRIVIFDRNIRFFKDMFSPLFYPKLLFHSSGKAVHHYLHHHLLLFRL